MKFSICLWCLVFTILWINEVKGERRNLEEDARIDEQAQRGKLCLDVFYVELGTVEI